MDSCMDWGMVIAIVATNIGLGGLLLGVMLWAFSKLDSDVKSVGSKIDADMRSHCERTDRLYEMFIELVRHKPKTEP
jgi:hypothetical protein